MARLILILSLLSTHHFTSATSPRISNANNFSHASHLVIQQGITVEGTVTEKSDPLPGVSVFIKGRTVGTVTDADGKYSLAIQSPEDVIVFSFIGYKSVEEPVGLRKIINVSLEADATELDEVVVTAMGLQSKKRELAFAVREVDPQQVQESHQANLVSALAGKVPGVQITSSSGAPGASASIRVRGNKSFRYSNGPLFVVDGVPVDNNASGGGDAGVDVSNRMVDFNTMDIESISVLSGPQATSLYGVRAVNGAVVVTTKKGKSGAPVITFSTTAAMDEVNKLPARQTLYAQGRPANGVYEYRGPEQGEINSWGPLVSELEYANDENYPYDKNGRLVPRGQGNGMRANVYDPYDALFIKGFKLENNLAVSGGSDRVAYRFSAGRLEQSGIVPNQQFKRLNLSSKFDITLTEKLSMAVSASYMKSGGQRIQRGSNVSGVMTGLLRNPITFDIGNGKTGEAASQDPDTYFQQNGEQRTMAFSASNANATYDNPFFTINRNPWKDDVNRFFGYTGFTYKLIDWVKLNYKVGIDHYTDRRNSALDINSASQITGSISQSVRTNTDLNSDLILSANKTVGDFEVTGNVGHNYYSQFFNTQSAASTDLSVPGFYNIDNGSTQTASQSFSSKKVFGAFADFKAVYKEYLIFNLAGRNDWSSTLPNNNNSFFYSSASLGWVVTEMVDWGKRYLSQLKFRGSIGQAGNDAPPYSTDSYFGAADIDGDDQIAGNVFPVFGTTAFERSPSEGNPTLRPELTTTYEVGADMKFLEGRMGLEATYYHSISEDQVVSVMISATSGSNNYITNAGTMENRGWEVAFQATPIETTNFNWDFFVNFSQNKNKVTELPDDAPLTISSFTAVSSLIIKGEPYGTLSGTRYLRNDQGQLIIGNDGWPVINSVQGVIGDPNPDWTAGAGSSLRYKNLRLSFLWDIRKGGDLWNGTRGYLNYLGVSKETGEQRHIENFVFDGVTESGDENTTPVSFADPVNGLSGIRWRRSGSLGLAEDHIEDGSWVRLRNISLSYSFGAFKPASLVKNAQLSVYATNPLLFTSYTGIDPETNLRGDANSTGWDYFNFPNTKTYGVTLELTFK